MEIDLGLKYNIICAVCGKHYYETYYWHHSNTKDFCSAKCSLDYHQKELNHEQ